MLLKWTAFLGAGALIAVTAMTSAARLWWVFDLFTHFRLQYVIAAMVLGAVAVAAGARGAAMALALVLVVHGWAIKDLWVGGSADADAAGVPLRIVSANVLGSNPTPDKVLTFVRAAEADLVVLVEVGTERWDEVRSELGAFYPYQAPGPGQERDPVRLYSRHPVLNARVVEPEGGRRPYLEAELAVDTGRGADPVVVIGVHPPSPSPSDAADSRRRNLQLDHIAETVANQVSPLIVAGDFNTSPWSPHFRDLLAATGLRNAADGHGWIATWPAWLWPARVPIDHVLIRGPVIAADVRRGPFIGSDHYPLIADLSLAGHVP